MGDKISAFSEAVALDGTEDIPIVQTDTKRVGVDTLFSTANEYWQGWVLPNDTGWAGSAGEPMTNASWDGDARSTEAATKIDLSTVFGVPAGVRAVLVRLECNDADVLGTDGNYVSVGPSATFFYQVTCRVIGGDCKNTIQEICTCDANGDLYYRVVASGTGTMDVRMEIWGYLW